MKSCLPSDYPIRPRPHSAGPGWAFVRVGQLIKAGDEFHDVHGEWHPTTRVRMIVQASHRNLYRRRIAR